MPPLRVDQHPTNVIFPNIALGNLITVQKTHSSLIPKSVTTENHIVIKDFVVEVQSVRQEKQT